MISVGKLEKEVERTISPTKLLFRWTEQLNCITRIFGLLSFASDRPRQCERANSQKCTDSEWGPDKIWDNSDNKRIYIETEEKAADKAAEKWKLDEKTQPTLLTASAPANQGGSAVSGGMG